MSALDDFLISNLKTIGSWRPRRQERLNRPPRSNHVSHSSGQFHSQATTPLDEIGENYPSQTDPLRQPSLNEVIAGMKVDHLPVHSALLGVCEDGLPFLLDLTNPAPGAILIAGDASSGKTQLIRSILASISRLNSLEHVAFSILAAQPEEYGYLTSTAHCLEILPVESLSVGGQIANLIETAEKRKQVGPVDPALILAIDDLAALLPFLDEDSFSRLYWLIRHGPRYRIWTIAAITADHISQAEPHFLTAFRTRLFGYMRDEGLARRLANDTTIATRDLEKGRQFFIPYGGDWLRFWICEPEPVRAETADSDRGVK